MIINAGVGNDVVRVDSTSGFVEGNRAADRHERDRHATFEVGTGGDYTPINHDHGRGRLQAGQHDLGACENHEHVTSQHWLVGYQLFSGREPLLDLDSERLFYFHELQHDFELREFGPRWRREPTGFRRQDVRRRPVERSSRREHGCG
jgi:hypothetical protein